MQNIGMGGGNIGIFSMGDVTTILESSHLWPLCGTDEHEQRARARRSPFPSAEIRFPKIKAVDRNQPDPDEIHDGNSYSLSWQQIC